MPHSRSSDAIEGAYIGRCDTVMEWVRQTPTIRNPVPRGQGLFYLAYKCQCRCRANNAEEFSSLVFYGALSPFDEKLPEKARFASAGVLVVSCDRKKLR